MNKQINFKLWVIKFCLKVIYPKYNSYTFLVFLAIKYRINKKKEILARTMETFEVKAIPQHAMRDLLQDHLDTNLPVLQHKCVLISKEQYIQLCAENLFYLDNGALWLAMKISPKIKLNQKEKAKSNKELLKFNLGFVTSEIHKKLWTDDSSNSHENVRIVPVVGSKLVHDNVALTTENEFSNIVISYDLETNTNAEVTFHPIPSFEYSPKIAAVAEVSLIVNDYDLSNDFVKEVLSNYFEEPKLVSLNDVFSIDLEPEITVKYHYKYLDLVESAGRLYFKCKKISCLEAAKEPIEKEHVIQPYFLIKGVTQLTLGENIHILKPKDQFLKPQKTRNKCNSFLHQCPTGLKHTFEQIQETITPFLTGELSKYS